MNCGNNEVAIARYRSGQAATWDLWETTAAGDNSARRVQAVAGGTNYDVVVEASPYHAVKTIHVYDPTGTVRSRNSTSCVETRDHGGAITTHPVVQEVEQTATPPRLVISLTAPLPVVVPGL